MTDSTAQPVAPPGHIKLSRKLFDPDNSHPFWSERREFSRFEAWVDVIQLAAFRARTHPTKYGPIELQRGEFVASLRWLADRWGWSVKRVRNYLKAVQEGTQHGGQLRAQRETDAGTVYRVVKYDIYQSSNTGEGTAKGTPKGTGRGIARAQERSSTTTTTTIAGGWTARLASEWTARVGEISAGFVGKALAAVNETHGTDRVSRAMQGYIAAKLAAGGTSPNFGWFVKEVQIWLDRTKQPLDVIDGEMSDTLELLTRPALRVS